MQVVNKRIRSHGLLGLALVLAVAMRSEAGPYYQITVLDGNSGTLLAGGAVNHEGQVVGDWSTSPVPGGDYAFLYDPTAAGKVTLLGIQSPNGQNPGAYLYQGSLTAINNVGQAIGMDDGPGPNAGPIIYNSQTGQVTSTVGMLIPQANNDSGLVVGYAQNGLNVGYANFQPISYLNGTVQDLGLPAGMLGGKAFAVNDAGQILVNAGSIPGVFNQSYLLNAANQWVNLGPLASVAINNNGDITGNISNGPGQYVHAALLPHGGSLIDLGTLPGDNYSMAFGMNNLGQVVGLSFQQNSSNLYQGFLYQDGVMSNLQSLIPAGSGWKIMEGLSINDQGQILALADNGSTEQDILLTPDGLPTPPDPIMPELPFLPEPSTLIMFGLLSFVGWRVNRRLAMSLGCLESHRD